MTKKIDEGANADTLKPAGGSAGNADIDWSKMSKAEMLGKMLHVVGSMNKQDLSTYLTKSLDLIGKEEDVIPAGTAEKNRASIAAKEDVEEIFNGQNLSEETLEKATTIFETVLNNKLEIEKARLEEEYENKLEEETVKLLEKLEEKIDKYLDHVVEEWMKENTVAIEQGYRTLATEEFISGLKTLFTEHFVEVPQDKLDVLSKLKEQVETLEEKINQITSENINLKEEKEKQEVTLIFEKNCEGMTETDKEKFKSLSENIQFENIEDFKTKLDAVKEQYFAKKSEKKETGLINEDQAITGEEKTVIKEIPEDMKSYVNVLSRTSRK